MSCHLYFSVQESNDSVAFQDCWPAYSIPFPDFRDEFVNSRDAAVSFTCYAIFAGGSSCGHGAVAESKGVRGQEAGSRGPGIESVEPPTTS